MNESFLGSELAAYIRDASGYKAVLLTMRPERPSTLSAGYAARCEARPLPDVEA